MKLDLIEIVQKDGQFLQLRYVKTAGDIQQLHREAMPIDDYEGDDDLVKEVISVMTANKDSNDNIFIRIVTRNGDIGVKKLVRAQTDDGEWLEEVTPIRKVKNSNNECVCLKAVLDIPALVSLRQANL